MVTREYIFLYNHFQLRTQNKSTYNHMFFFLPEYIISYIKRMVEFIFHITPRIYIFIMLLIIWHFYMMPIFSSARQNPSRHFCLYDCHLFVLFDIEICTFIIKKKYNSNTIYIQQMNKIKWRSPKRHMFECYTSL